MMRRLPLLSALIFALSIPPVFAQNHLNGSDISIAMAGGGEITLEDVRFIRTDQLNLNYPELTFKMVNNAKGPWKSQAISFDMWGVCKDGVRHWSDQLTVESSRPVFVLPGALPVKTAISSDQPFSRQYTHVVESLAAGYQLQGCATAIIQARQTSDAPLANPAPEEILTAQQQVKARDEAIRLEALKEADKEERERKAEKEREQRKIEEEANKRLAREIMFCHALYRSTSSKKVSDLTVKEEEEVRACQFADLYR